MSYGGGAAVGSPYYARCQIPKTATTLPMLETTLFDAAPPLRVTGHAPPMRPADEARVEALWQRALAASSGHLFNGRIAVARKVSPHGIEVEIDEYRRLFAARADPELRARLDLQPLAVSGLLRCAGGIVFGRRGSGNTEAVGQWELAPSGGLDAATLLPGLDLDPVAQLLVELDEELGLSASAIASATPFCAVTDRSTGVIDIGIALEAPTLSAGAVVAAHAGGGSHEYVELRVMKPADLGRFIAANHSDIVPVSLALLAARGLA